MRVIDLRGLQGMFKSSNYGYPIGTRSFGLWSYHDVNVGDLVVIERSEGKYAYLVSKVFDSKTFTGSDGNRFWYGEMKCINYNRLATPEIQKALAEHIR